MNKKNVTFVFALVCLLVINVSAKKKHTSKRWINEEKLLITDVEKAEFAKLKKEKDRGTFIKLFWAKRDSTPLSSPLVAINCLI